MSGGTTQASLLRFFETEAGLQVTDVFGRGGARLLRLFHGSPPAGFDRVRISARAKKVATILTPYRGVKVRSAHERALRTTVGDRPEGR